MSNLADYVMFDFKDGKGPRKIRFGYNQISDIEIMSGKSIQVLLEDDKNIGLSTIRVLLWGALGGSMKGITLQAVGNILETYFEEDGEIKDLSAMLQESMQKSKWLRKLNGKSEQLKKEQEDEEKNV